MEIIEVFRCDVASVRLCILKVAGNFGMPSENVKSREWFSSVRKKPM